MISRNPVGKRECPPAGHGQSVGSSRSAPSPGWQEWEGNRVGLSRVDGPVEEAVAFEPSNGSVEPERYRLNSLLLSFCNLEQEQNRGKH